MINITLIYLPKTRFWGALYLFYPNTVCLFVYIIDDTKTMSHSIHLIITSQSRVWHNEDLALQQQPADGIHVAGEKDLTLFARQ